MTEHSHRASLVDGIPIDDVTVGEALEMIAGFVELGRTTGRTFQVATVNVDFVVNARRDADVRRILQRSDLNIADGMPILWYSSLAGTPLRERVAGADLVPLLVERSATNGHRILLFGSAEGVAERARDLLRDRFPGAHVEGVSGPFIRDVHTVDDDLLDELRKFRADIICVALGNPKQERWIAANRERLGVPVLIGVGGTLDFLVGGRRRAPSWMQRFGLEWIFRALQEPKRLGRRYARDARVFAPVMGTMLRRRGVRRPQPGELRVTERADGSRSVDLDGVSATNAADVAAVVARVRDARRADVPVTLAGGERALSAVLQDVV